MATRVAVCCSTFAGGLSLLALAGWLLHVPWLTTIVPAWPTMKFGTATAMLAASVSLLLGISERRRRWKPHRNAFRQASLGLSLVPLIYGVYVFLEKAGAPWLPPAPATSGWSIETRPSIATAVGLALCGIGLLAWRQPRRLGLLSVMAGLLSIIAWLGMTRLLYDMREASRASIFSTLSLPTALSFFAISAALFCLRPKEGVARVFSGTGYAGQLARWLVPVGALITLGLGALQIWAHRHFEVSISVGVAVYGIAMFVALTILGLRGAWLVDRLDQRRRRVERQRAAEREAAFKLIQESQTREVVSEQRFRGIFENTSQFVGLLTPTGHLLEANQTALNLIGARIEDVRGLPFIATAWWSHSETERAKLRDALRRAVAGETVQFQTSHPGADGRMHYIDFTLNPVLDAEGRVVQLVPEGRDVTEHKHFAETLAANEELLRQFIKHTPAAIAMLDNNMCFMQASDRWLKDYHLDGQNIIGRSHYEVFPDIPQHWKDIHQRVLTGQVEYCEEDPFPRSDGSMEWLQWEARPWRKPGGEVGGLVFYTQVITARKKAEEHLRESEENFRGAFEGSAIGMALVALDGRWLRVNDALCTTVGRPQEELLRCTFQDITHPEDLETDLDHVRALLAGESDHYQMEKRYVHKDGRIVWVLLTVTLLRDPQGRPLHFISQIKDITERHEADVRLQESLNEKEVLLREIHHRVKNNMQVITSLLQLQADYLHDARDATIFRECQERIHAMSLVHDHLYRSGNLATISFSEYLRELASLIIRGQNRTSKRIQLAVEGEPIQVNLDTAIPLGLITAELISNAYKHAFADRAEGKILVRLTLESTYRAQLSVIDNGVGIPADFNIAKARSLGLRLIQALSRQLRAEFSVASAEPGTKMSITLPLPEAQNL